MTADQVKQRLLEKFTNANIEVEDSTGNGSFFTIAINSEDLASLNRVQRHQAVMAIFSDELKTGEIHALSIKAGS